MKNRIRKVCLIFAMREEAQLIIDAFQLTKAESHASSHMPFIFYEGQHKEIYIDLAVNGVDHRYNVDLVGPIPSALIADYVCRTFHPDLIISCGTAGGFRSLGADIGDIYTSAERCIFHDRHVPLPRFVESALGSYPVLNSETLAYELSFKRGIISTGSSLEKNEKDLRIIRENNASVKEMEAASIAWVCGLYEIPFLGLKSITNLLDMENSSQDEFCRNMQIACASLADACIRTISYLLNKSIDDL